ncbi:Phosphoenolpyruvate synthase [Acaryochloris thomasi RCC1774]|uniref:Phosphoenolpyruvate synthase n=1 Tax=Acaryochloris thomasi RCC1774 TaxID=1764569 RepID=A0A2W1JL04_9CYAN|nr:putative PEP-binding protein [Acaryochloris thomasi]PZD74083.1 Phosphoenolpyruvate synthase [Acaryochloris thomasi RCC1774]
MTGATDSTRGELYSLYTLDQIQAAQPSSVGTQALWLSQLPQESVVESAVISADVLQLFLERLEWQSPLLRDFPHLRLHFNLDQPDQLQSVAQTLQASVEETDLPLLWSQDWVRNLQEWSDREELLTCADERRPVEGLAHLRVSLTPSLWLPAECESSLAGLTNLITPQYCCLTPEALAHSVKQLWKQLFQAQILYLWEQSGLSFEHLKLAIILQPLPAAPVSGWFQLTAQDLLIQVVSGLPVGLLLGDISPSLFQVNRRTGVIASQLSGSSAAYGLVSQAGELKLSLASTETAFSLSDAELEAMMALATELEPHMVAGASRARWSLCHQSEPRLWIHELAAELPRSLFDLNVNFVSGTSGALVEGLPAAPGVAIASPHITHDLQAQSPESVANTILVVPYCQPSDLPWLRQAAGLICEQGGLTSHGAILARELGLPAIVGFSNATTLLQTGQQLRLDGDRGAVYPLTDAQQTIPLPSGILTETALSLKTQVWVTLSQFHNADAASQLPVDGIGLLRSEWLLLDLLQRHHPQQWIQQGKQAILTEYLVDRLQIFLEAFAPRPVFYRTLDGSSRELAGLIGGEVEPFEVNPALGLRGVARYQADPRLFDCELAALAELQQRGWDNVRLLLPFVRSVEEFVWCCDRISTAGLFQSPKFEVWIMAEVPSVLFLLEDYVKAGVQGIAIGSNDMTQLILGVDRDRPLLDRSLNTGHPAVMAAISQLIQAAKTLDIPCSLCGQVESRLLEKLVEWGITAVSVDQQSVPQVRRTIANVERKHLQV